MEETKGAPLPHEVLINEKNTHTGEGFSDRMLSVFASVVEFIRV